MKNRFQNPNWNARRTWALITVSVLSFVLSVSALAAGPTETEISPEVKAALSSMTADGILSHVKVLASDEFEGRAPGTPGEEKTVDYLVKQLKQLGLQPGNPDGTYLQDVPLVGYTAQPTISFAGAKEKLDFHFPSDSVIWSRHFVPEVKVEDSPIVFVGYGVVAPEYGWDDFKDVDVRGKTLLMLVNDPPVPDPNDPSKLDEKMFKGYAMTYYGRWTYKYEIAAAKGAKAAIIVHQTGPAGYPWGVIMMSSGRENFGLQTPDSTAGRVAVEGWVTVDNARRLVAAGGQDFDKLKRSAVGRDFRPVALDVKANFTVKNTLRPIASRNVVAKVQGSDPKLKNEYIIYTAHWDHLGRDPSLQGDQIFNGAADNASGTAAVLELAKAFAKTKPKRTILFLFVTAEEKGLLGAKYYAEHPLYPLARTLANINIDVINVWGRSRDARVIGRGQATLEDILAPFIETQGRVMAAESDSSKGYYFRSDHFEFAKVGVPALYLDKGTDLIGKPAGYGAQKHAEYVDRDYHKVSDEIKSDWDLSGAVEDLNLLFDVGYTVSQGDKYPQWKQGSEFKARRG